MREMLSCSYRSKMRKKRQTFFSLNFFYFLLILSKELAVAYNTAIHVDVGLIIDMNSRAGKMSSSCISIALSDFYASHSHYKTRLILHTRDSNNSVIGAAEAATDLLKNVKVQAIIGPQTSIQANYVIHLGEHFQVPIVSFSATSSSLSSLRSPYFVQATINDSSQAKAIGSLFQAFQWKAAVPIYVDSENGEGIIPLLADALQELEIRIPYRCFLHPSAKDDEIVAELSKLIRMQTRVFIVHMPPTLGYRLFARARDLGMMDEGFVWIITTRMTNQFSLLHSSTIESMEGVLGIKPHVPRKKRLEEFIIRWKRKFQQLDSSIDLNMFGLWAYDAATALAMAVEEAQAFQTASQNINLSSSMYLETSAGSQIGKHLPQIFARISFNGLSGTFNIVDGQLQSSYFQIVNIISNGERGVGFWTPEEGISKTLNFKDSGVYSASKANLKAIIWPGEIASTPKGWTIPMNDKKLRLAVPVKNGSDPFVNVERDPETNTTTVRGYAIDVFDSVMEMLPYRVPYEYVPFAKPNGESAGTVNDLVYQVYLGNYDAVVGDITIRANRSRYVDFTQPYIDSGIAMAVPFQHKRTTNAWVFLKPLTWDLWVTCVCFFVFIGFVIWILEHRINEDFSGSSSHQVGTGLWFSFSVMVFAHREKVVSNLARFVVIIWCFVVLILTQSYTASLSSMLTIQQLVPTVTDWQELIVNGDPVGYPKNSFIFEVLKQNLKFDESKLKPFDSIYHMEQLLSRDKVDGGITAAIHALPFLKLFVAKYCSKYTMVTLLKTNGFGFAFPIGSPLVPDISRAILNLTEGSKIAGIERKWYGPQTTCPDQSSMALSNSLGLNSFWGLFLIVGIASTLALTIFASVLLYEHRHIFKHLDAKALRENCVLLREWLKKT